MPTQNLGQKDQSQRSQNASTNSSNKSSQQANQTNSDRMGRREASQNDRSPSVEKPVDRSAPSRSSQR